MWSRGTGKGKVKAKPRLRHHKLGNWGSLDFRAAAELFVNSLGGAEQTIALLGDADFLQGPSLARPGGRSGQPGPEQRGFWSGGAANHLLLPLGH